MAYSRSVATQKVILTTVVLMLIFVICESNSQRLCGSKLTETLKFVCKNNYNPVGKKSVTITDYYDDDMFNFDTNEGTPFMNKIYAGMLSPNIRRIKEGIVNECCRKPCTIGELRAYCYAAK